MQKSCTSTDLKNKAQDLLDILKKNP